MPAGAAVGAIGGAVGGYFNSRSAKKSARAQAQTAREAAALMSSGNVMNRARAYNPYIFNALMNPNAATTNPFQQQMNNLAGNPGYIDPALMNLPLTQAMRGQQQGMMAAQGQLGRSGMEGGIGDAYALASQAALTGQRAGIMQNTRCGVSSSAVRIWTGSWASSLTRWVWRSRARAHRLACGAT